MEINSLRFAYDINSTGGLPFILMPHGSLKGLCFLIDTGCTQCMIYRNCLESHKDIFTTSDEKGRVFGVGGKERASTYVSAMVSFFGKEEEVMFLVMDDATSDGIFEQTGVRIHGILGTDFMQEHNMLIDFVNQRVIIASDEFRK